MNCRSPRRPSFTLTLTALLIVTALAWQAQARPIDMSVRTSVDAPKSAKLIQDEVQALAQKLASENAAERTSARNALVDLASASGGVPSVQYLDILASAINDALKPLATNQNVLVRLNTAIVVAKVAAKADSDKLAPNVLVLLDDKNEAVVLWGIRAAKDVAPAVLRNPALAKGDKLLPAIVAVAQKRPTSPIIQEAYDALTMNYRNRKPTDPAWKAILVPTLGEVGKLMRSRLAAYQTGAPVDPVLEVAVANFLVHPNVLKVLDANEKATALQLVCDLMALAANRSSALPVAEREPLIRVIKDCAKSMQAAATVTGNEAALKPVLDPIQQATVQTPNLTELVSRLPPALQKLNLSVKPTTLPTTKP